EVSLEKSAALSMAGQVMNTIATRQVAILAADGVNGASLTSVKKSLLAEGAVVMVIAPRQGYVLSENNEEIPVDESFLTGTSVVFDAVYVPGGMNSVATLEADPDAVHFLNEAFKHCKAIAADTSARQVLEATYFYKKLPADNSEETILKEGIVISDNAEDLSSKFIKAIKQHRFWQREKARKVPA
ncbi:MAG: DJ-1/PfpI family protein, partial [Chitinophagaceae bacterium]